ncbi:MAG: thioredoxin [archaeon]
MIEISDKTFTKETKNKTVIVDFWAEWCGPCKMMEPMFKELSKDYDCIVFAKMNVDEHPDFVAELGIQSIPTLIVFKNGKETDRIVGMMPKPVLKKKMDGIFGK